MKKNITLLLIILSVFFQSINAQTNPALITNFTIKADLRSGYQLSWAIANNEVIIKFELQKSVNGRDYTTVAVLLASEKTGTEKYVYEGNDQNSDRTMYRLRMLSKGQEIYYSNIILFHPRQTTDNQIKILGNPVADKLILSFTENSREPLDLKIYNMSGILVLNLKISEAARNNIITIPLSTAINPGVYIAEITNSIKSQTIRFVKQ